MKISVITVCLNEERTIRETIESVITQTKLPYEYLIIDGQSKDGTLEIAREYEVQFPWISIFSEKDYGLYEAMNRGTLKSSGDYVVFLNSGDLFYNHLVLERLADIAGQIKALPDIFYGDVIRMRGEKKIEEKYGSKASVFWLLLMGRMPCHQTMFTRRQLLEKYPFDYSYQITADYHFLMQCYKNKTTMFPLRYVVAVWESEKGISSQAENLNQMRKEDDRSLKTFYPTWYLLLKPIKFFWRKKRRSYE